MLLNFLGRFLSNVKNILEIHSIAIFYMMQYLCRIYSVLFTIYTLTEVFLYDAVWLLVLLYRLVVTTDKLNYTSTWILLH